MVNPVASLDVQVNIFGAELDLIFGMPSTLPVSWKLYLFKRSETEITQTEIDNYFANIDNLQNFNYNGLFVFDSIDPNSIDTAGPNYFPDYKVLAQITYYYKAVIRNETTKEISSAIAISATPEPTILVDIADGKAIVAEALEKMLDNVINTKGHKVRLGKDIKVEKSFSIEPLGNNYFMIERVNGSEYQRFWGNQFASYQNKIIKGEMDSDVIRVTFMTNEGNQRRDQITNLIRSRKQFLMQFIKKIADYNVVDVNISVEGDYINPAVHGVSHIGVNVIFSLLITNYTTEPYMQINQYLLDGIEVNNDLPKQ